MLYNHQKQTFWNDGRSKCRPWKFFQRPSGYNMCHKLVQIDQNYQSHQMCVYFFRGSLEQSWSCILHCHCSSPLHVWFVQKLVRLIVLISPVKILNNMIHPKSLKKFFSWLFDGLSSKNSHFWYFQGLYKQFFTIIFTKGNWKQLRRSSMTFIFWYSIYIFLWRSVKIRFIFTDLQRKI